MVQYYTIAGQKLGSHVLAIGVLSTMFGGIALLSGGKKADKVQAPPINASSKDEENFIQEFLKQADSESREGGAKH